MSNERKNPILVTITVLTAIVGLVTALYKCGSEQQNFLKAVNTPNTQEETKFEEPNNTSSEVSNTAIPVPKPPPPATSTNVSIIYTGDQFGCTLPISITIGDKTFQPTSNAYTAYDIPLGTQQYRIQGNITCTSIGGCAAYGEGLINVRENATFAIRWQNTAYAQCSIGLFEQ